MSPRAIVPFIVAGILSACAAEPISTVDLASGPASPLAPETPPLKTSGVLTSAHITAGENNTDATQPASGMDMKGMDTDMPGMNMHSDSSQPSSQSAMTQAAAYYTCTMHPQIHQDHPGNCPICGMTLVKKEADANAQKGGTK